MKGRCAAMGDDVRFAMCDVSGLWVVSSSLMNPFGEGYVIG
jgi:hypothetical protein